MIENLAGFFATVSLMAIPIYLTNGFALILGGKTPLDFNKTFFDKKPLLGKGKTVKGTIFGIVIGSLGALAVSLFIPQLTAYIGVNYFYYGILLSIGAVAGDILGSFVKRRISIERGKSVILLDQLDFLIVGIVFGSLLFVPTIWHVLFLAIFTASMHKFSNVVAFKTRIKRVPW